MSNAGLGSVKTRKAADSRAQNPTASVGLPFSDGRTLWASTIKLAALFWLCVFVTDSLLWGVVGVDPVASAIGKLVLNSFGAALTIAVTALLFQLRTVSLFAKVIVAFAFSILAAAIYSLFDLLIYYWMAGQDNWSFDSTTFGHTLISAMAMFFGWSCLYVALIYSFEVRDRERSLALAREEALTTQMRALRYQINPHFLFNTLNSIAGLIEEGASTRAERMVLSLSTFLRTTLTLDPLNDVPLIDELALQEEYLEIERERFSDRMELRIEMSDDVRNALVPSLILQPLVENAVKHGVGTSTGKVEIVLQAYRNTGRLHLIIENDMSPQRAGASSMKNTGIGLKNVAERIQALFRGDGSLTSGPIGPSRYSASLDLPLRFK